MRLTAAFPALSVAGMPAPNVGGVAGYGPTGTPCCATGDCGNDGNAGRAKLSGAPVPGVVPGGIGGVNVTGGCPCVVPVEGG